MLSNVICLIINIEIVDDRLMNASREIHNHAHQQLNCIQNNEHFQDTIHRSLTFIIRIYHIKIDKSGFALFWITDKLPSIHKNKIPSSLFLL